jgi:hypothetical protein
VARTGSRYGPRDHNSELEDFINASGSWSSVRMAASQKALRCIKLQYAN